MRCIAPFFSVKEKAFFPCGQCSECRTAKVREWTLRNMLELRYWNDARFRYANIRQRTFAA